MPQFTQWQIVDPAPNILFNPMAIDESIAKQRSELGTLDINQQRLQLERDKLAQQREAGAALLGGGDAGGGTTGASSGDSTTETADDLTRAAAVRDGLIKRGMQPEGATAFAANALHESRANPFTGAGDAGASHGIFQWNSDRLAAFRAANGGLLPEQTNLDKQLDFVVSELHGSESTALGRIMGAQGVADKAGQVSEAYLRPKDTVPEMQRRSATALRLARAWGGQGTPGSAAPAQQAAPVLNPNAGPRVANLPPAVGAAGGPNITPGMTDQAWLDEMAKRYPAMAGPNDTSQRPNATMTGQADPAPSQLGFDWLNPMRGAPSVTAPPDTPVVAPSPVALRTGGTDVAGPGAGPVTMGPVDVPNTLYQTGLPGISIRGPGNGLAPPVAAAPATAPPAPVTAPAGAGPPGGRPPILQPPPAPSRVIPMEPLIQSGPAAGLTDSQRRIAAAMITGGTPVADVGAHMAQWRQQNIAGQQQAATNAALEAQANFERQKYIREQQIEAEKTQYQRQQDAETARRNAAADARAEQAAKNAGLPPGYRMDDKGVATRIDGLPPDPAVAEAAKAAYEAELRKQPFQGNSEDAQNRNILLTGDPKSPAYHSAYASFADPKTQEGGLIVKHNMQPYRMPQDQEGNPITTYDQPSISIGPGDLTKLRAFETGAATLKSALDDFAKTSRNASAGEWTATVAGQPTDLSAAWTNAALMAKGTALYELGVLSGPDMTVLRGALADPSTFRGAIASNETIDKQVARIKGLLDTRLDQARRSYGGGMSASGTAPPAQAPPPTTAPVNPTARKADTVYQTPKGPLKWTGTGWVAP